MIIVVFLAVLLIAIMSMILRSACWLYNRIAGTPPRPANFGQPWMQPEVPVEKLKTTDAGAYTAPSLIEGPGAPMAGHPLLPLVPDPDGVPEPESGQALGICLAVVLVGGALRFGWVYVVEAGLAAGLPLSLVLALSLAEMPLSFLLQIGIIALFLPTTPLRAFFVVLLQIPIVAFVIGGIWAVVFLIGLATGMRMFW